MLSPVDERTVSYVQDPKQADHRHEIGGSLGGPIVRGRLFFFGSLSPRFRHRIADYKFSNGLEPGTLENTQTAMNAYGKDQLLARTASTPPSARSGRRPTPTAACRPTTGSARSSSRARLASNQPNQQRGFTIDQRNLTGTMDINLTDTTLLSVKAGYFRDDYRGRGRVRDTTPVRYRTSSIGLAGVPPELQGAQPVPEHAGGADRQSRHDDAGVRAGRLQRGVHGRPAFTR